MRPFAALSPIDIARLEEERQASGTAEVAREAEPIAGGWMAFEAPGAWANQASGLGLAGPVSSADVERLVAFYESRGVEPRIEVCSFADETLVRELADRAFVLREFEDVFARELPAGEDLRTTLPHGWPEGVDVTQVPRDDAEAALAFAEVATSGFRAEAEPLAEPLRSLTLRLVAHSRCDSYVARLEGTVAGGGTVEVHGEVAALIGTSVLPAFRRRGIQAALIVRRLERARERGARVACIHSRPGVATASNARRLGFTLAYTKVVLVRPGPGLATSG